MLDSIAAARFARAMPITHALLEAWASPTEPASARNTSRPRKRGWRSFRFDKFAVVGGNSPRNQLPMLSGATWPRPC